MHQCITRLLSAAEDEESLECLCRLLSTIGKELENPMNPQQGTARTASNSVKTHHLVKLMLVILNEGIFHRVVRS